MKKSLLAVALFAAVSSFAQVPSLSDVTMTQAQFSRLVTITYRLGSVPAIVTLDIQTNGVSIGDANLTYLAGDVNRLVTNVDSTCTITWQPDKSWPGHKITDNSVYAVVSAWSTNTPPDYMVVDLVDGTNIEYYTSAEALPAGGLTNAIYRNTRLVMRKIAATGVPWTMGARGELTTDAATETPHSVTLTNDYYIGVFECTQGQWANIKGNWPSYWYNVGDAAGRPVEQVSYNNIRGSAASTYYPDAPASDSFLGLLRAKTGLAFDLPGEAQWEYACRAGNYEGKWGDGSAITAKSGLADVNLDLLGRYQRNGGRLQSGTTYSNAFRTCTAQYATATAGSYRPNSWGLYDMHGNVWEWCLDWYGDDIAALNGAVNMNTASGSNRVMRGGSWYDIATTTRSANRYCNNPSSGNINHGFRPALNLGL